MCDVMMRFSSNHSFIREEKQTKKIHRDSRIKFFCFFSCAAVKKTFSFCVFFDFVYEIIIMSTPAVAAVPSQQQSPDFNQMMFVTAAAGAGAPPNRSQPQQPQQQPSRRGPSAAISNKNHDDEDGPETDDEEEDDDEEDEVDEEFARSLREHDNRIKKSQSITKLCDMFSRASYDHKGSDLTSIKCRYIETFLSDYPEWAPITAQMLINTIRTHQRPLKNKLKETTNKPLSAPTPATPTPSPSSAPMVGPPTRSLKARGGPKSNK